MHGPNLFLQTDSVHTSTSMEENTTEMQSMHTLTITVMYYYQCFKKEATLELKTLILNTQNLAVQVA